MAASDKNKSVSLKKIQQLLKETPFIDGHNDLPWNFRKFFQNDLSKFDFAEAKNTTELQTDIPRMRKGLMGGQFFAIFIRDNVPGQNNIQASLEQIDVIFRMIEKYSDAFALALNADDVMKIHASGKIACLLGLEGAHCICNSIEAVRMFYRIGVRYLTIAYMKNSGFADSSTDDPKHNGLSELGKQAIKEMNKIGMMADLSHSSNKSAEDAIKVSSAPIIFSHSCCDAVCKHPRNVSDNVLKKLSKNGGIVMVTFVGEYVSTKMFDHNAERKSFSEQAYYRNPDNKAYANELIEKWKKINPAPRPSIAELVDHIDCIRDTCGIDHIGIGSDFEGYDYGIKGLDDTSYYPAVFIELLRRGYSDDDIKKIAGLNIIRVMRQVQKCSENHG